MSATIKISRLTGAGPSYLDINGTNTRCNAEDSNSSTTGNPIAVPGSGTNYSFWCTTQLTCSVAPATALSNIRWYTDGSNSFGTGVTCLGNTTTSSSPSYVQATGVDGVSGDQLTTGSYPALVGSPTNVFAFTSGSPLSIPGSIGATTGHFGGFLVFQIGVGATASPGATAMETFTWIVDES